ncbi:amino acid transporter [Choiromyces venosus 120613-1]|uniref:Amino acid transporter n=1 Tax=Choiromyces venosus 120613-1 TaxID=1336337 RepID=A0A3N4K423_9PEZI|nr:amino acid transporter [Choiromyces venosus 120613-1]
MSSDKSLDVEEARVAPPRYEKRLGTEYDAQGNEAEVTDEQVFVIPEDRKLGIISTVFLIINKMIGSGVFSTPSGVLAATGSVGIALILWLVGGILALCGLMVYLEFGLGIPRSGGDKVYMLIFQRLERIYTRPKYLASCTYAIIMVLLGNSAGNTITFGRYILLAAGKPFPTPWEQRGIAVGVLTFCCLLHSFLPKWGVRLSNALGVFKVVILLLIVFSGFAALAGNIRIDEKPNNFTSAFEGRRGDATSYTSALLNIIYSYRGWENANYVLGEIKNPQRTLKLAAPVAVIAVTVLYMLVNIAYFAAVPKEDIIKSGVTVAGKFFINMFGDNAATRALPVIIALSALGNVLSVTFANPRVKQELAKEGVIPFSRFFASDWPFRTPAAALLLHWAFSVVAIVGPPAGDAYTFVVELFTYSGAWVFAFIATGLLYLQYFSKSWSSPFHCHPTITILFLLSNAFLVIVPFIPPEGGISASTPSISFYVFPTVGTLVLAAGVVYWALYTRVFPWIGGYHIEVEKKTLEDGTEVVRYKMIKKKQI